LTNGYQVHGIKRRSSSFNTEPIDHTYQNPRLDNKNQMLFAVDLTDTLNLVRIVNEVQPDEINNLGAQSHLSVSFETPVYTADVDAIGTLRLLSQFVSLALRA
jgi:GDPmannose 4,6-dehydratase